MSNQTINIAELQFHRDIIKTSREKESSPVLHFNDEGELTSVVLGETSIKLSEINEEDVHRIKETDIVVCKTHPNLNRLRLNEEGYDYTAPKPTIMISDRGEGKAWLLPVKLDEDGELPRIYRTETNEERNSLDIFCTDPPSDEDRNLVLDIAQIFGHTTGWAAQFLKIMVELEKTEDFRAALKPGDDSQIFKRKAKRIVREALEASKESKSFPDTTTEELMKQMTTQLYYDDEHTPSIEMNATTNEVLEIPNFEATLLWIGQNLELTESALHSRCIINDMRQEIKIIDQLLKSLGVREKVSVIANRYAFKEWDFMLSLKEDLKIMNRIEELKAEIDRINNNDSRATYSSMLIEELESLENLVERSPLQDSALRTLIDNLQNSIYSTEELKDYFELHGIDPKTAFSADFATATEKKLQACGFPTHMIYQAICWNQLLKLEELPTGIKELLSRIRKDERLIITPPVGRTSEKTPKEARETANAELIKVNPDLNGILKPDNNRPLVVASQGTGIATNRHENWVALIEAAKKKPNIQFVFIGVQEQVNFTDFQERGALEKLIRKNDLKNVTILPYINGWYTDFLKAMSAKDDCAFFCRSGLSTAGMAEANGIPPYFFEPDKLPQEETDDFFQVVVAPEVAMERALYIIQQYLRLKANGIKEDQMPTVLLQTTNTPPSQIVKTVEKALDPEINHRIKETIPEIDGVALKLLKGIIERILAKGEPLNLNEIIEIRERVFAELDTN